MTRTRLPPTGPRDPETWLTLLALAECDRGAIDAEAGAVWVGDTARKVKYRLDPAHLDALAALGWVD